MNARPLFKSWDPEIVELYTNHGMKQSEGGVLLLTCPSRREASMFMGGMQDDPWPLLSQVTCPTLIIEGEESENRALINLKMVASAIPQGTHRLISNEGHLLPLENPKLALQITEEFFGAL
jgi:pimeloyl-ACP methyl ester carboxylesterase